MAPEWVGDSIYQRCIVDDERMGVVAKREESRHRHLPVLLLSFLQKSSMLGIFAAGLTLFVLHARINGQNIFIFCVRTALFSCYLVVTDSFPGSTLKHTHSFYLFASWEVSFLVRAHGLNISLKSLSNKYILY